MRRIKKIAAGRRRHGVLLAWLALPASVHAAWETVPEVTLFAESDDNVLLDPVAEQSASRMALDAALRLSNFNERGNVFIEPRFVTDAYSGDDTDEFESDELFFNAGGDYRWRTVGAGFRSRYSDQSVLNSEFVGVAPGDPDLDPGDDFVDPDTGRVETFSEDRELFDIRGNLDFQISERNELRIEMRRQSVDYSGSQQSSFRSDFDDSSVALALIRQSDDRNTITARMIVSEFNADSTGNATDSFGLEGIFARTLGPTLRLMITAGVQRNEFSFIQQPSLTRVENADTHSTFGVRLRKRAERANWNVDYSQRVQPNGNGYLVVRDNIRAYGDYQFSPRLTFQFGIRYTTTEPVGTNAQIKRDYTRAELGVEWALKETMILFAGYNGIDQEFGPADQAASNSFLVGLTYRGRSRQGR